MRNFFDGQACEELRGEAHQNASARVTVMQKGVYVVNEDLRRTMRGPKV